MERDKAIFNDYLALRSESLQSMNNRNSILTFGLASMGVVFLGAVNAYTKGKEMPDAFWLAFLILSWALPALSQLLLFLWLGEAVRMRRVGYYLKQREDLINEIITEDNEARNIGIINSIPFNNKISYWENYIRLSREELNLGEKKKKTGQMMFPFVAVVALFIGVTVSSVFAGILFPLRQLDNYYWLISVIALIVWCLIGIFLGRKFLKIYDAMR